MSPGPHRPWLALCLTGLFSCSVKAEANTDIRLHIMDRTQETAIPSTHRGNSQNSTLANDVWQRLTEHSVLPHQQHSDVEHEIKLYRENRYWTERKLRAAGPYLHFVLEQLKQHGLPAELALIPIIESRYDPRAKSHGNAAGLWQFVPVTARGLGLTIDRWRDERKSVERATTAALEYMAHLYSEFNNWSLAVAAYNAGPSRLRARIRKHGKASFQLWDLPVPQETRRYVAKFYALQHIVAHRDAYGISLPPVQPHTPFRRVDVGERVSLNIAAQLVGIPHRSLEDLNHELITGGTPPDGPHTLLVPAQIAGQFEQAIQTARQARTTLYDPAIRHTVAYGETLGGIAVDYQTSVKRIMRLNGMKDSRIRSGQKLLVGGYEPNVKTARKKRSRATLPTAYRVREGDTLSEIAQLYGVDREVIAHSNNINDADHLRVGKTLTIPKPKTGARHSLTKYTVRVGDTLSHIALQFNVSLSKLKQMNPLLADASAILPGQRVIVPTLGF